jgi:hypothetical protein
VWPNSNYHIVSQDEVRWMMWSLTVWRIQRCGRGLWLSSQITVESRRFSGDLPCPYGHYNHHLRKLTLFWPIDLLIFILYLKTTRTESVLQWSTCVLWQCSLVFWINSWPCCPFRPGTDINVLFQRLTLHSQILPCNLANSCHTEKVFQIKVVYINEINIYVV